MARRGHHGAQHECADCGLQFDEAQRLGAHGRSEHGTLPGPGLAWPPV